jgi:hypothetical protein
MCNNHDFSLERWLPIIGYEGYYDISDFGRVRSLDRYITMLNRWGTYTTRLHRGQLMTATPNMVTGYYSVGMRKEGKQERRYPHEMVLTHFVSERPEGCDSCHGPLGKACNAVTNLEWNTHVVNQSEHRLRDGTLLFGETAPWSKLTDATAREIFCRVKAGESQANLAREFDVAPSNISMLIHGKIWKHLNLLELAA